MRHALLVLVAGAAPGAVLGGAVHDPLDLVAAPDADAAEASGLEDPDAAADRAHPGAPASHRRVDLLLSYADAAHVHANEDPDGFARAGVAAVLAGPGPVAAGRSEDRPVYYVHGAAEGVRELGLGAPLGARSLPPSDLLFLDKLGKVGEVVKSVHGAIKSLFGKRGESNDAAHSVADAADCGAGKPAMAVAWGWVDRNRAGGEQPSRERNGCSPGEAGAAGNGGTSAEEALAASEGVQRAEEEARAERERAEAAAEAEEEAAADGAAAEEEEHATDNLTDEEREDRERAALDADAGHSSGIFDMIGKFVHKDTLAGKLVNLAGRLQIAPEDETDAEREARLAAEEHARLVAHADPSLSAESAEDQLAEIREARARLADAERSATNLEHTADAEEARARRELSAAHDSASDVDSKLEKLRMEKEDLEEQKRVFHADKTTACRALARIHGFDIGDGDKYGTDEDGAMGAIDKVLEETEAEEDARLKDAEIESHGDEESAAAKRKRELVRQYELHHGTGHAHPHVRSRAADAATAATAATITDEENEIARYKREARAAAELRRHEEEQNCREDRERRARLAAKALAKAHKAADCAKEHPCPVGAWAKVLDLVREGKVVAKLDHFDPSAGDDGASAFDNIRDAAAGHRALRSKHSDAPGGSVCLSVELAELIAKVAESAGVVEVNSIAGSSHRFQKVHYDGVAVDLGALGDHTAEVPEVAQKLVKACQEAGASVVINAHMEDCDSEECARTNKWVHCAVVI